MGFFTLISQFFSPPLIEYSAAQSGSEGSVVDGSSISPSHGLAREPFENEQDHMVDILVQAYSNPSKPTSFPTEQSE